jgi:copper(I)-binding protein
MKTMIRSLALCLALSLSSPVFAGADDVAVEKPWARASIGMSRPGAAYMTIHNSGNESVTLTGLRSDIAMMVEVHRTTIRDDGASSMSPAGDIVIAPGEAVVLEPGGLHAMLMKLRAPMKKGTTFPLTLVFGDGGEVTLDVPIHGIGARGPGG